MNITLQFHIFICLSPPFSSPIILQIPSFPTYLPNQRESINGIKIKIISQIDDTEINVINLSPKESLSCRGCQPLVEFVFVSFRANINSPFKSKNYGRSGCNNRKGRRGEGGGGRKASETINTTFVLHISRAINITGICSYVLLTVHEAIKRLRWR